MCDSACTNIDPPFCHCLACMKTDVALSLWGECVECQSCIVCVELCTEISATGKCSKCKDRCTLCCEKSTDLLENGQCKACKACPPGCGNTEPPYCHCVGRGCGQRRSDLNSDGECPECVEREKAMPEEVIWDEPEPISVQEVS